MDFSIRPVGKSDQDWVLGTVRGWGADFIISRGRKLFPAKLEGFLAEASQGERVGQATFEIIDNQCELVTLDAFQKHSGIGTALLERVAERARERGCERLWLITLNDNLEAIRFYQRRRMTFAAIHLNTLEHSRRLKPAIPQIGQYGIPLRDEIEFEMSLS